MKPTILFILISLATAPGPARADDEGLDDYISAITPRSGTNIKTGSTATRSGSSASLPTGSAINSAL